MKCTLLLMAAIISISACQTKNSESNTNDQSAVNVESSDKQEITSLLLTYRDALNASDVDKVLQLYTEGGRVAQQVYWGADLIQLPEVARLRAGPLPETGSWVRLRIPVETLEMEELWLSGLLYAQYGGRVVWGPTTKSLGRLDRTPELLLVTEEGRPK